MCDRFSSVSLLLLSDDQSRRRVSWILIPNAAATSYTHTYTLPHVMRANKCARCISSLFLSCFSIRLFFHSGTTTFRARDDDDTLNTHSRTHREGDTQPRATTTTLLDCCCLAAGAGLWSGVASAHSAVGGRVHLVG